MPRVKFYYDLKKDAWSNLFKKLIKEPRKRAELLVLNYLKSHPKKIIRKIVIAEELKTLKNSWEKSKMLKEISFSLI